MASKQIDPSVLEGAPVFDGELHVELTEQERADIRARAREEIREQLRKQLVQAELARAKIEAAQAYDPREKLFSIMIELPPNTREAAPYIWIDGRQYNCGQTYQVPQRVFDTLREIMFRQFQAEAVRQGTRQERDYRREVGVQLNGAGF